MQHLNFYRWGGEGRKTVPILALHGFTGSGLDFEPLAQNMLNELSWCAPDLMGHGKSPVSEDLNDYTLSAHIKYLDEIVKSTDFLSSSPFVLLGYSMGGRLALRYALERPELVGKLILVGATPGIENPEERKLRQQNDEALAQSVIAEGVDNFLRKWQAQPIIKTQENIPEPLRSPMMERRLQNHPIGLTNTLRVMGTGMMEPLWDRLGEIKCPVTLITGETDQRFYQIAEQMTKLIPRVTHKVIPKAGHAAIWENFDYFASLLKLEVIDNISL